MDSLLELLGELFPYAVGVAVSPLPIIAVVVVLMGDRTRASGIAFLLGRIVGLGFVIGLVAVVMALLPERDERLLSASIRALIGLAVIVLGVTRWRPRGGEVQLPGWMSALEQMAPARIFGVSVVLCLINVKELLLIVGVAVTIGDSDLPLTDALIAIAIFVAIASSFVALPVIATLVAPQRVAAILVPVRAWLVQHQSAVIGTVLLVIGALLVGNAIQDF